MSLISRMDNNGFASNIAFIAILIIIFSIPWENMIVLSGIGTISRVSGIIAALIGFLAFIADKKDIQIGPFVAIMFIFILYNTATFFWSSDQTESLKSIITIIQIFVLVLLTWVFVDNEKKVKATLVAYLCGSFISIGSTILDYLSAGGQMRYAADNFNSNDIALLMALGIPISIFLLATKKNLFNQIIGLIYIPSSIFAIILTGSRGGFLAALTGLALLSIYFKSIKPSAKLIIILIVAFIAPFLFNFLPDQSLKRLSSITYEISNGTLNSRIAIWSAGLKAFAENPIFGIGIGNYGSEIQRYLGHAMAPHNFFISVLVEKGIIGLSIILFLFLSIFKDISKLTILYRHFSVFIFLTLIVGVATLGWEHRKATWFIFTILAIIARIHSSGRNSSNEKVLPEI